MEAKEKGRFLAQYMGLNVVSNPLIESRLVELTGYQVDWVMTGNPRGWFSYIHLVPLAGITMEDAFEVARIVLYNTEWSRRFSIVYREEVSEDVINIQVETFIPHPAVQEWRVTGIIQIDTEDGEIVSLERNVDTDEYSECFVENVREAYDFLRSKRYAVGYGNYSIEKLVEEKVLVLLPVGMTLLQMQ
jgi:hypothetical protein